jgi:hypothetical protein
MEDDFVFCLELGAASFACRSQMPHQAADSRTWILLHASA